MLIGNLSTDEATFDANMTHFSWVAPVPASKC